MTERQYRFVNEYFLSGANGTAAAKAAGYSSKSAHVTAARLLRNAKVGAEIERRRAEMAKGKIMTSKELQEFLSEVVRGKASDEVCMTRLIGKGCSVLEKVSLSATTKDRLRAAELLLKVQGAFEHKEATNSGADLYMRTLEEIWKKRNQSAACNQS